MDGSMSSRNRGRVSVRPGYRNEVNPSGHEERTLWGMRKYQELCYLGNLIRPHFGLASWTIDFLLWGWKALRIFNRFIMAKITGISDLGLYCRFMLL